MVQVLQQLRQQTALEWPKAVQMLVSVRQAQFLAWLVGLTQAHKLLEVGTFTGYSALAMAQVTMDPGCMTYLTPSGPDTIAHMPWSACFAPGSRLRADAARCDRLEQ